jgi:hypothetical protein
VSIRSPIRTVHLGFGPIGRAVFELLRERSEIVPVAVVDLESDRVKLELASKAGVQPMPVVVAGLTELPAGSGDVVVQCTGSRLSAVAGQILEALDWGASVLSTCEELAFPWRFNAELAQAIDKKARLRHAVVLATGVNPGFAMDALPMFISAATTGITAVRVRRVVDAARRRGSLQRKVGAGISRDEFNKRARVGSIGHVGLRESVAMIAAGLRLEVDSITSELGPLIAESDIETSIARVPAGSVAGIHETATGRAGGKRIIVLDLRMYVGASSEEEEIELAANPPIQVVTRGIHGDVATAAILRNLVPELMQLPPGLRTMLDVVRIRSHGI